MRSCRSGLATGASAVDVLDYDKLVANFEARLVTQLRGHSADADYLESWVPDEDVVKSLLNMVEAASAYGRSEFTVWLSSDRCQQAQIDTLRDALGDLGALSVKAQRDGSFIVVSEIKSGS